MLCVIECEGEAARTQLPCSLSRDSANRGLEVTNRSAARKAPEWARGAYPAFGPGHMQANSGPSYNLRPDLKILHTV